MSVLTVQKNVLTEYYLAIASVLLILEFVKIILNVLNYGERNLNLTGIFLYINISLIIIEQLLYSVFAAVVFKLYFQMNILAVIIVFILFKEFN